MGAPTFFSPEWAAAARDVLRSGPSEHARAGKLQEYWDFYELVRANYVASWALGVRDLPRELGDGPAYLRIEWAGGQVKESRIVRPGEPVDATYVLAGDYADWKALYEGYDALRTVMYRKLILQDGQLLEFFKAIYFFVECLALLAVTPTRFPSASG